MTDSQFNYSGLTLEELRTLAASPQVGAMEAMPHAFRHLADRVGEVGELLSRAQADLPNWWKGQAAEQAAAALGRAAAEAHEFHGSAQAAAAAVSRCATIVAEQQHQMMGVPEEPEPGVTDTIIRPKTPMDALEAARQDAAYQAARQKAVQVVNGIAAQYVETRDQLSSISIFRGETFEVTKTPEGHQPTFSEPDLQPKTSAPERQQSTQGRVRLEKSNFKAGLLEQNSMPSRGYEDPSYSYSPIKVGSRAIVDEEVWHSASYERRSEPTLSPSTSAPRFKVRESQPRTAKAAEAPGLHYRRTHDDHLYSFAPESSRPLSPSPASLQGQAEAQALTHKPIFQEQAADNRGTEKPELEDSITYPSSSEPARTADSRHAARNLQTDKTTTYSLKTTAASKDTELSVQSPYTGVTRDSYLVGSEPTLQHNQGRPLEVPHAISSDSATTSPGVYPPLGGVSPPLRGQQRDRNPRPSYLKERKSVWVTDTVAAPPDGIITPEWLRQA